LLVGGRGALRRDGALLRHRLRRRATRRIPRGRWRGRLSRWRRRRRRSLRGCRAGCHQSCQDQKKRLSLHGEQMLPRYRCSLLAGKPTGVFGLGKLLYRLGLEQSRATANRGWGQVGSRIAPLLRPAPARHLQNGHSRAVR
jgi:hypothetical protein